jgi:hypothetical protein
VDKSAGGPTRATGGVCADKLSKDERATAALYGITLG